MLKVSKIVALILTAVGVPTLIIDQTSGSDISLLVGLFIQFN